MTTALRWTPSKEKTEQSNLHHYQQWLADTKGLEFNSYDALWNWSVENTADFWESILVYFDVKFDGEYHHVVDGTMPHCRWFEGIELNYAEHIFRKKSDYPAIIFKSEKHESLTVSWETLWQQVGSLQQFLKNYGVKAGDRVAAYLPGTPEATVAFLATNALGAIWSSCSPDFGTNAVIDRFAQIHPKILIATDSYAYGGKSFDKNDVIDSLMQSLPTVEKVIVVTQEVKNFASQKFTSWKEVTSDSGHDVEFTRVPFSHPIWILYSSGTTGLPKAITHSHGGILLEQLKYGSFHNDFKPGEKCFWYTTTGWMMWNYIHGALLAGATMVLYDGSPAYPTLDVLWKFSEDVGINHFGTSAGFILANMKAGTEPSQFDLSVLRSIGSTGSTLPPEGFDWVYQKVKEDLWLASMSGGTDVCSAFVGGNPTLPVYSGEIQCRALGCKLEAFDEDAHPVIDEVGEMVITKPMPSMPVFFWNDSDFARYTESYFDMYPGIWRHGDWIQITPQKGVIIYGRSDATLNRGGIRIGTSEIYRAIDQIPEIKDSLIICLEKNGGEFWMPLFVVMKEGQTLTPELIKKINSTIRAAYSPRHVPDVIIEAPDIPYTISGKKTEMPVKKVLMGKDPAKVVNAGALRNPESMRFFASLV